MKNTRYIAGGLTAMLIVSVFVSFGIESGDELFGRIKPKNKEMTIQPAPMFENPCYDTDYPDSLPFSPRITTPQPFTPGITYGVKGTNPNSQPWTDYCSGDYPENHPNWTGNRPNEGQTTWITLREYSCNFEQGKWKVKRTDIECDKEYDGKSCRSDGNGLGYCG